MKGKVLGMGVTTAVVAIAGLALCIPNALWLKHSTIRISNQGDSTVPAATLQVGELSIDYRSIEPGEAEFALLPKRSKGSVAIMLPPNQQLDSFCHAYVDAQMYHLDVTVEDGKVLSCDASLPLFTSLWVMKALF